MIWTGNKLKAMQNFIEKVEKMRQMQREYFKTRDQNVLRACIELEKEVDNTIKTINHHQDEETKRN